MSGSSTVAGSGCSPSAEAVKELCAKKRHLGGLPGILAVLHTWNGRLGYHPHVHMLITGGGISSDGEHWQPVRGEFLVPVGVLSKKIAAKFRDTLRKEKPDVFASIPTGVWRREWVSFVKHYGHGNSLPPSTTSKLQTMWATITPRPHAAHIAGAREQPFSASGPAPVCHSTTQRH
jgi:hypothetical protein